MKTITLLLLACAVCKAQDTLARPGAQKPEPPAKRVFVVSKEAATKEGHPQFMLLWNTLQQLDPATEEMAGIIEQVIGKRADTTLYRVWVSSDKDVVMQLLAGDLLEKAFVKVRVKRDGIWQGNTATGVAKKLELYRESNPEEIPKGPTQEEFMERLKEGKTYDVILSQKCDKCGGEGKLGALQNYAVCPQCNGLGTYKRTWVLKW